MNIGKQIRGNITPSYIQLLQNNNALQIYLFFQHHFSKIYQPVTHSAQGCVNTAVGGFGNFFKTHISKMSQHDYFPLLFGQFDPASGVSDRSFAAYNTVFALSSTTTCYHIKNIFLIACNDGRRTFLPF
jgi:hypothetical protein